MDFHEANVQKEKLKNKAMKRLLIKLITPALQTFADAIIQSLETDTPDHIKYMLFQQGVILDWYCVEKFGIYLN